MTMNRETTLSLRKFVFTYIIPMFTIALVLVLMSYINDMREEETKQQLNMLDSALAERDAKIAALEERVAELEDKLGE
ncbi:MAG: hypothetical protein VB111_07790 [Clostridiaceae bacterium]|nr:hypothetical protein [Clostridiaceae bacterium]